MRTLSVGLVAVFVLISGEALADIGKEGQLAVGAERITGYTHSSQSSENDVSKSTQTSNNFSLFGMPYSGLLTAYSFPRLGIDYFVTDGLGIGGSLTYTHVGASTKLEPAVGPSVESSGSINIFLISPRIGYAYMFTDSIGIWPRGGVTYYRAWTSDDDDDSETKESAVALSIDVPFIFAAADNVAFTAGPTLDYGLSYSAESTDGNGNTTKDEDSNPPHEFGVQAGLTVFF